MEQIIQTLRTFDGVLELAPAAGSPFPEIAWGDHFFYYAPDGLVPERQQPYATIVTKNYPDDTRCDLDDPDRWRLNIHVGTTAFTQLTGEDPRRETTSWDYRSSDVLVPHPVYRTRGWIAIVNPAERTHAEAVSLLRAAHDTARRRAQRRRISPPAGQEGSDLRFST